MCKTAGLAGELRFSLIYYLIRLSFLRIKVEEESLSSAKTQRN
jgi:hypothetical protein